MSRLSTAVRKWRRQLATRISGEYSGGPQGAHFVRDYRRYVKRLIRKYPLDEAMSYAVGGNYEETGKLLAEKMIQYGLRDGMHLLDFGCGSGRLAQALASRVKIDYLGLDVVPELLAYAKTRCPAHYRFAVNEGLSLPAPSAAFDMVSVFSVFTHLLHEESFLYLCEIERVLRPGGIAVISFLEFAAPEHWGIFEMTIAQARENSRPHLNVFVERSAFEVWASHAGLRVERADPQSSSASVGQSILVLVKPEH